MATATISREMLSAHPLTGDVDQDVLAECITACFECVQSCTACADACLSEEDVSDLRKCIRLNMDCADVCNATGRLVTRQTGYDAPTTNTQLTSCQAACAACAEECERHAGHHEHCRICAKSCRRCEQACTLLLEAMK
jgi:uncharacterized protein DUF326